ncbi:MAG: succinate dehydrogenase cytochrome b subunit [Bacteroidetes bacterium]|nr:succinate dehydrogenase cytochrome b subunit [Bacteroidota bacterium]
MIRAFSKLNITFACVFNQEKMITSLKMFYTSVGRKLIMALTGLFLCVFLLEHLYGNLQLYKIDGGKAFNEYTEFMTGNMFIRAVEFILFAGILVHALDGLMLTLANRKARPVRYAVSRQSQNSTWFSRNMGLTGSILFVFFVIHLREFFFAHRFGGATESMAASVANAFTTAWYASLYIVAMIILGFHLNHGFQSAFQTLGLSNHKYIKTWKCAGTVFALIMMIGFASVPVMLYFDFMGMSSNILGK